MRRFCLLVAASFTFAFASPPDVRRFDIPPSDAVQALRLFSQQSGEQILYPAKQLRGIRTRAVSGELSPSDALRAMLDSTGLTAVRDEASGALLINAPLPLSETARKRSVAPPAAQDREALTAITPSGKHTLSRPNEYSEELVVLSPFEVQSHSDRGYKASDSISATRTSVPIRDLPLSVTAYTEDFISDQKPYDLYDVVKWCPGVHQDNVSPQGWVRYNIRGFTSAAVQRNGFGSFRFIDTTNIARVEVVKGPVSLLYGQINPGGVINYITKRPESEPHVQASAAIGDLGYSRFVIDATGPVPVSKGLLKYRLIAMTEGIQSFDRISDGRKRMLAPSATFTLSSTTSLTVEMEHFDRHDEMLTGGVVLRYNNGVGGVRYPGLPWNFNYAGEGDYQKFASDAFTAELVSKLGEYVTLRATYLDSYWDMEWRATGQGGTGLIAQTHIDPFYPASAGLTPADAMFRRNRWEHQWGGERTLQADLLAQFTVGGANVSALLGVRKNLDTRLRMMQRNNPNDPASPFYLKPWDLRNPATWSRAVPFGREALGMVVDSESSSESSSVVGVLSASVMQERLKLLAGYARHSLQNDPSYNYVNGVITPPSSRSAHVPQAGVLFKATQEVAVFASYSESFLANTSMLRVNNVPTTRALPSVGKGLEGGLKVDLIKGKLSGTVSAYRIQAEPTGIITVTSGVDPNGTTLFTDVQGGSQLSRGVEFDLVYAPVEGLQLMAGFSRCDAIFKQHPIDQALNGSRLVATPDRTYSLWGKYTVPSGPAQGLMFTAGVNHVGDITYVGNNPRVLLDPYTTIDVGIGYSFRAFGLRCTADIAVKNLTDQHYYLSATSPGFPRYTVFSVSSRF